MVANYQLDLDRLFDWVLAVFRNPSPSSSDEVVDAAAIDAARARAHKLLRQEDQASSSDASYAELFARFVASNREDGIDPSKPEPEGAVTYRHKELVPMQGDPYWTQGRTVSSAEIDRRFRKLEL